jgi:uncharacterized membrane protein YphA (DoxX/SURF4 family)
MNPIHHSIRRACAVIIGLVFFVAGMLKLMDPVGAGLVVSEYLKFFGFGALDILSGPVGALLALLETLTGAALVTGVFRKAAAICASALTGIFTAITFALWVLNPSMDCGCFGEAVHLTHFQSFAKNIILCVLSAAAFIPFRNYGMPARRKYVTFALIAACSLFVLVRTALLIPYTDFTPFNHSSRLAASVESDPDGEDRYVATFIYEKNGQEGTFTLDRLPDSTWTYVRTETMLRQDNISETDFPALSFTDGEGSDRDTLAASGLVMAVSVYRPSGLSEASWHKVAEFLSAVEEAGFTPLLLVSGVFSEVEAMLPSDIASALSPRMYTSDYKTLISLNRSNGGVSYFNGGNLIQRWARRQMPSSESLAKLKKKDSTDLLLSASTKGRLSAQAPFLYSFILMLI